MMASAASLKDQDSITVITEGAGAGPGLGSHNNPSLYDRISLEKVGPEAGSPSLGQGRIYKKSCSLRLTIGVL